MADINDLIIQDFNESDDIFTQRKEFTLKIYKLNQLSNITAVTFGRLLFNKIRLNVEYDVEIENLLSILKY